VTASTVSVPVAPDEVPILRRLSTLDRFLPLWICAAMALGILLGRVYPDLGAALDRVQLAGVSVPIAVGLLWMMYPVLAKVRYETIGRHARDTRLLGTSLVLNWVLGPLVMLGLAWAFVPDTPTLNTVYFTADRPDDFCRKTAAGVGLRAGDVLAFGHTHEPWHRTLDGVHFVNTGSVGRPKDGDWRAGYVLLDLGAGAPRVEHVRVAYDLEAAIAGVRAAGLPEEFAEFLRTGGRPVTPVVVSA
jgi:hypothetical protein